MMRRFVRSGAAGRGVLSGSTGTDVSAAALCARAPRLSQPRRAAERERGAEADQEQGQGGAGAQKALCADSYDVAGGRCAPGLHPGERV